MKNNLYTIILFSILGSACGETLDEPGIDWYSDGLDTDGDYIINPHDDCPLEQEDYWPYHSSSLDQVELSTDGCPTIDNDGDGVDDKIDACPNDPECWTDSCLVGMTQTHRRCESHICYRGECIRNDIRYSCSPLTSDHQNALRETRIYRTAGSVGLAEFSRETRAIIQRGIRLVVACEQRLEENWLENQRTEN